MQHHYILSAVQKFFAAAMLFFIAGTAGATTQTVQVSNTVFTPASFNINLGDTVKWVWVNGVHTTTSLGIPGGAAAWNSDINSVTTQFIYVPAVLGTYNYWCTIHGSFMTASFTVNCGVPSVTISAGGSTTFCSGGSAVISKTSTANYSSYQWKRNGSAISGETNTSTTATLAGSYTLVATNSCSNQGTSNAIAVTVNSAPTSGQAAISAGGSTTFCSGGNVVLTVATAGLTYQWKDGGSAISGATSQSYSATATGNYSCDVSNSCGTTGSNSISVTVNSAPTGADATISAGGATTFCSGGNVVLTVASAGFSYQWKNGGSTISGATLQSYSATATGNYSCDVSNSCGTTGSNPISVTVNTAPTAGEAAITAGGATTFCSGGSVTLTVATAGLTYQWKNVGSAISGATLQNYTATASGGYTCDVSNSCGTTTSNSISVTVNTAPTAGQAAISASGATTFCKGGSVTLSVATVGLTYQWKQGNKNILGATMQSYLAKKTYSYSCIVSNSCGTITSNLISVVVNPTPTASITQAACSGGAILLTCNSNPSSGVTFQWKKGQMILSGATNSTYNATVNGTYKCTVTITSSGCSKASPGSSVTITCKLADAGNGNQVLVYPNPASDYFNINTSQLDAHTVLHIYDLAGRLVEIYEVSGGEMQVGRTLSNGVYFLKIELNHETQQVIKLVKNF